MARLRTHRLLTLLAVFSFLVISALIGSAAVAAAQPATIAKYDGRSLSVDVSENMAPLPKGRFAFQQEPVHPDGLPAYGNPFVTMGYIYPAGTLDGDRSGVNPDGSPEFPDRVIGEWICRGWFIGDGGKTASGPMVVTTQVYNFGDEYGQRTLVSDGYELADVGVEIKRAITGGTGPYQAARGESRQALLGLNATQGVKLRVSFEVQR